MTYAFLWTLAPWFLRFAVLCFGAYEICMLVLELRKHSYKVTKEHCAMRASLPTEGEHFGKFIEGWAQRQGVK